jgi:adenosine deaminase
MSRDNVPFTLHAGEILKSTHSIENLKYAIRANPERIGHAIVAGLDKSVFSDLVSSHIPVDLCPISNLITNGEGIKEYLVKTIKLFAKSGVEFSLGSDDPSFFKTNIYDQYQFLKNECQIDLLE